MNEIKFLTFSILCLLLASCSTDEVPQLGKASLDKVIEAMTLEEKVQLVVGTGRRTKETLDSTVKADAQKVVPGVAGVTYPIPRLGIPSVRLADGPAGMNINPTRKGDTLNTYYCTHFPIGTLLASTWNQELVEEVGYAIGNECLEYGGDVLLAPALNIHRNPLCGRNFEYFSEDPVVSGKIAAAYIKGAQKNGVGVSVKHYAINNQESNRMAMDTWLTPRAAREIYLKGFEIVVKESKPMTIMSSYPHINGVYGAEHEELLTTILRDEWGYKGMVMSDWYAGSDPVASVVAGNDMLQPGLNKQFKAIVEAVENGTLDVEYLDRNVRRILEMILQTPTFNGYAYSSKPDLKAHADVTRQSAVEGMVLLKNEASALPLASDVKKIALLGCTSYDFISGGTGSGDVNSAYKVSLFEGLTNQGYELDNELKKRYDDYIAVEKQAIRDSVYKLPLRWYRHETRPREILFKDSELAKMASEADAALITLGRNSGEYVDRPLENFHLTAREKILVKSVTDAFHKAGKKVVVVMNIGGVIETASWKDMPDAILCAWQAGQEGGNSVADVLSGAKSPSGKLPMTFPNAWEDAASSAHFPTEGRMCNGDFENHYPLAHNEYLWDWTSYYEDVYVGYRYFDSFGKEVSYPFGYGLSYTAFEYSNASVERSRSTYTVKVDVTNTGSAAGKEIVQLYVTAPDAAAMNKPEKELKAFAKTRELQPGETQTLTLTVDRYDLASYDESQVAWVVDEGDYNFLLGASSRDIRAAVKAPVKAAKYPTNDVLKLPKPIDLLKR